MVEVFKTDVKDATTARTLLVQLQEDFPHSKINFDLDDCDNILRIESESINAGAVVEKVTKNGFFCAVLE